MKLLSEADVLLTGIVSMDKYALQFWGPPLHTRHVADFNGGRRTESSAYLVFPLYTKERRIEVEWAKELK